MSCATLQSAILRLWEVSLLVLFVVNLAPYILALCETNLKDTVNSNSFLGRSTFKPKRFYCKVGTFSQFFLLRVVFFIDQYPCLCRKPLMLFHQTDLFSRAASLLMYLSATCLFSGHDLVLSFGRLPPLQNVDYSKSVI